MTYQGGANWKGFGDATAVGRGQEQGSTLITIPYGGLIPPIPGVYLGQQQLCMQGCPGATVAIVPAPEQMIAGGEPVATITVAPRLMPIVGGGNPPFTPITPTARLMPITAGAQITDQWTAHGNTGYVLGYTTAQIFNQPSGSIATPSQAQIGDLLILAVQSTDGVVSTPTGWTRHVAVNYMYLFTRLMQAGDPTTWTISTGTSTGDLAIILVATSMTSGSPTEGQNSGTSTTPTTLAISASSGNQILAFFGNQKGANITPSSPASIIVSFAAGTASICLESYLMPSAGSVTLTASTPVSEVWGSLWAVLT